MGKTEMALERRSKRKRVSMTNPADLGNPVATALGADQCKSQTAPLQTAGSILCETRRAPQPLLIGSAKLAACARQWDSRDAFSTVGELWFRYKGLVKVRKPQQANLVAYHDMH